MDKNLISDYLLHAKLQDKLSSHDETCQELAEIISDLNDALKEILSDEGKELYAKFKEQSAAYEYANLMRHFEEGFKVGLQLAIAVFFDD